MNENVIAPGAEQLGALLSQPMNPPPRILLVDDDEAICRINADVLAAAGYNVDAAEDGAAAREAINSENYDLVITDNKMAKVTGVELLKMLRGARMVLPVIMASGSLPTGPFATRPWLQPAATLLKPYTLEALLTTVRQVLGGQPDTRLG